MLPFLRLSIIKKHTMKEPLYILGDLVHQLQKERGCTSMFLCSEGGLFSKRSKAQFAKSDAAIKAFQDGLERWNKTYSLKPSQLSKLTEISDKWSELPALRTEIMAQSATVSHSIDYYSHKIISPILQNMVEIAFYMEGNNPTFVSAYNAFLQWKERIGLERAIGARGFIGYSFHNKEFVERVLFLLSEQNNYQNTYMALANELQKQLMQDVLKGEVSDQLDELHETLRLSPESSELHKLTPEAWFDLLTAKIDTLHAAEMLLVDTLSEHEQASKITTTQESSSSSFGKYDNLINSLQLFSGLSKDNLNSILQHGQIREFNKGKLLFLEGEQANRLYIILKGWVKIFKGTASGEETILQMLSSGDSIMESAVFLNTSFPVSAQIAEDAVLLSIPAPVIREQVKNNNELALNLLASMSYRSQGLIRQIENARLKSADERTGWFLLKLMLEQGSISKQVELPYDKSLIASYLDMKRETFSRSLKRLKEKGFKIENDTIIVPDLGSLCGFCEPELAQSCSLHGTSECIKPECASIDECA